MRKRNFSITLFSPTVSLIGLLLISRFYVLYLENAALHFNYNYWIMCAFQFIKALWFFTTIAMFFKNNPCNFGKSFLVIGALQIVLFVMVIIIAPRIILIYQQIFDLSNYIYLWVIFIAFQIYKSISNKKI